MKILVLGYIVRGPLGGLAWHHFQYVLGLKQLGHEVLFLEDSDEFPSCYNPLTFQCTTEPFYGLEFIDQLFRKFDLSENWAYHDWHTSTWYGCSKRRVMTFTSKADIVMNISGINPLRDYWKNIPCRVFIDTDPGFVQIKNLTNPQAMALALAHTVHFSFAENIGKESCSIPDDGFVWKPTRQAVFLAAWTVSAQKKNGHWTTVMQWDSYKEEEYQGKKFGMKSLSFAPYFDLPKLLPNENFEISLGSATAPKTHLVNNGWKISDPYDATRTPEVFQDYIQNSKGEWSVAKQGYVASNSGWFSERTLNYMASGKPVVVQDTGFSSLFPVETGLLSFTSLEEAIDKIDRVNLDYKAHGLKAREIVEEFFCSKKVLETLLNQC